MLLDGKKYATLFKEEVKEAVEVYKEKYAQTPQLAVILVGEDPASQIYVRNKERACQALGIESKTIFLPADTSAEDLKDCILLLNADEKVNGILLQLPLPTNLKKQEKEFLKLIAPEKDVDGFHPENMGKLVLGQDTMVPCTPQGCIAILKEANISIAGKHVVIVGRSNIVGKPLAFLFLQENATVTICHSHTENLATFTKMADILVAAVGKPAFIKADMVKEGAVVLDVGINRLPNKKLMGDVEVAVRDKASYITPVPGGIGPLTIAMLMRNTLLAARRQRQETNAQSTDV